MRDFENINNILVSKDLAKTKFTCKLDVCKGACCTIKSEFGAPLKKEEIETIQGFLPIIKKYLSKNSILEIENNGFWEEKEQELMIRSINNEDCVFVYYEGNVAKCSIEKAYNNEEIDFIKPISCHLFPIRVADFGGDVLRYEIYDDCKPALEKGNETNLSILEFCEIPIKRAFNNEFYHKIVKLNGK